MTLGVIGMIFSRACGFVVWLAGLRVRRVLLLAGLVFAALPVGSALAATTVGQTGTPLSNNYLFGGRELVQSSSAVHAAGVVTSFHTRSGRCNLAKGSYDFQVLRPLGVGQYQVLGDAGNQTDPCDGQRHSYPVNIQVQAGDVIGVYVVSKWQGLLSLTRGSINFSSIAEPAIGSTVTLPLQGTATIDESATLVPSAT
ncbi:MAG: hypothetical protein ACTHQQ_20760 [Solirubrobacteraceae bacterium]